MNTSPATSQQTGDLWMPAVVVGAITGAFIYFAVWGLALKFSTDEKFTFTQGIQSVTASFMPGTQPMDGVKDDLGSWLKNEHPAYLQVMTYVPYVGGTLVGLGIYVLMLLGARRACRDRHIDGRRLLKGKAALTAWRLAEHHADGLQPHRTLPAIGLDRESRHLIAMGSTGGGKTQVILPLIFAAHVRGDRMVVFDNKGDFTSVLPGSPVILAPWDNRSVIWDVAADVETLSAAREFSARMIPQSLGGSPMWVNAARLILTGCVVELQSLQPGTWGFGDLVQKLLRPIGELTEGARQYFPEAMKALGQENVTTIGIQINLMTYLAVIFDLARAWPAAPAPRRGLSVRKWLLAKRTNVQTVILQSNGQFQTLTEAFNCTVLDLMNQLINSPSFGESKSRKLWFFLDEFPQLGKVESIFRTAAIARSKGVKLVIGVQDLSLLKDTYGDNLTNALMSMVGTHVVARVSNGETADYISQKLVGKNKIQRLEYSQTTGSGRAPGLFTVGGTQTASWRTVTEPVMLPSKLTSDLGLVMRGKVVTAVRVMWLGIGEDALITTLPLTQVPSQRLASILAAWVSNPSPFQLPERSSNPQLPESAGHITTIPIQEHAENVTDGANDAAAHIGNAAGTELSPPELQDSAPVHEELLDAIDTSNEPDRTDATTVNLVGQPASKKQKRRLVKKNHRPEEPI